MIGPWVRHDTAGFQGSLSAMRPTLSSPAGFAAALVIAGSAGLHVSLVSAGFLSGDPAKYRTREEVQEMREHRDPIDLLRKHILEEGKASEADLKEIDREVRARVNEAAEFAQSDPEPDPSELYTDVTAT